MKVTGPRKMETGRTIAELEKQYRKSKKAVWADLAVRLKKPRKQRPSVNLWKLEKLANLLDGKILVVPGKVLGFGEIRHKATIVALEFSEDARKKISSKGTALSFREAIEKKIKPNEMVLVK